MILDLGIALITVPALSDLLPLLRSNLLYQLVHPRRVILRPGQEVEARSAFLLGDRMHMLGIHREVLVDAVSRSQFVVVRWPPEKRRLQRQKVHVAVLVRYTPLTTVLLSGLVENARVREAAVVDFLARQER